MEKEEEIRKNEKKKMWGRGQSGTRYSRQVKGKEGRKWWRDKCLWKANE